MPALNFQERFADSWANHSMVSFAAVVDRARPVTIANAGRRTFDGCPPHLKAWTLPPVRPVRTEDC